MCLEENTLESTIGCFLHPYLPCLLSLSSMKTSTLLMLKLLEDKRRLRVEKPSFKERLSKSGRQRRDRGIPRLALQNPSFSAFETLFGSGCDQLLITLIGFDHTSFNYILGLFEPVYVKYTPYSNSGLIRAIREREVRIGRPRSFSAKNCLGLVFSWERTRGSEMILSLLFGISGSVCSLFIRFGRRILLKVLIQDSKAAVRMPTDEEIPILQSAIQTKYKNLKNVYAMADGLKLYLEQSSDCTIQNMFYNGWTHDHYVSNVFVFSPAGVIISFSLNAPGATHDSSIADYGGVYKKLKLIHDRCGARCVVDSAFSRGHYPFLLKSSQDYYGISNDMSHIAEIRKATSLRQSSEWGMRGFKGSFPRIKDRFVYEERGERKVMLFCFVLLFNLRKRLVGLNQILSNFMPNMGAEANYLINQFY